MKKKFLVFTSSRAEYGIMKNLIKKMQKTFDTKLIVTGTHLSKKFGFTVKEINKDNIKIYKKISTLDGTKEKGIAKTISNGLVKFTEILTKEKFQAILVCGDRYETLAPCIAASFLKIPIIHFHGGEITRGSYDDVFRHMITKMSTLHFVSHTSYKKRVFQLGENKKNIYNFGAIGLENKYKNLLRKAELEKKLKIKFNKKNFLVVIHPETQSNNSEILIKNTLNSLKFYKDTSFFFTGIGADLGSQNLTKITKKFVSKNNNSYYFESLGRYLYFSILSNVDCIIGNSSSAIYDAPTFQLPAVNIGNRQSGRVYSNNIINSKYSTKEIKSKINKALNFNRKRIKNIFYRRNSIDKVIEVLKNKNFSKLLPKDFFDLI